ncbi:MAG: VapC toxin family PIN domain ribonuclease [Gammaproteobacteria bacterium]|nr:MAG: VapC toxin family PIN domain ribonuclease [Gammaproteobacteria bacterium]
MILVDTSIWIDHLRKKGGRLVAVLEANLVLIHPFIIGELACGNLRNRDGLLGHLHELPQITVATDSEVLHFIQQGNLMARGVGYLDMHLLASVQLHGHARLWTRDKRLAAISRELQLSH